MKSSRGSPSTNPCMVSGQKGGVLKRASDIPRPLLTDSSKYFWMAGSWAQRVTTNNLTHLRIDEVFNLEQQALARNSAGFSLLVWSSYDNSLPAPHAYRLAFSWLAPDATSWTAPAFIMSQDVDPLPQQMPALATLADGSFLLIYVVLTEPTNATGWYVLCSLLDLVFF